MIKVGIIGCGAIYSVHADAIKTLTNACLAGVCDMDLDRAQAAAEKYECAYYTDYKEMIKEVDAVHLCLPHYLHAPIAIDCLKSGKAVITEKPMAIKYSDAVEMVDVSKQTGSPLHVIFQNRFNDGSLLVKGSLDDGRLGKVISARAFVTWHREADYYSSNDWKGTWDREGGGVIINQSIHTLDLMRWFVGSEIKDIDATMKNRTIPEIEVEDTAEGMITFECGAKAFFYATNGYGNDAPIWLEILCEKGTALLTASDAVITFNDGSSITSSHNADENGVEGKGYWGNSHKIQIENFYNNLESGEEIFIPVEEALKTQKMICDIYEKGRKTL
ncbi:MAG: Gfo/Idh/MocA family oxidoreductase [Eubacteriales bacterium]|nr:Gfo/Idh/MocA family oxidoreductase [Eubacteriales bacterium]